ncbi:hypothetical protein FPD46_00530 [Campylobacter peloridis]|uniref:Uncharacterized protein n=1 Tax=Campylobacter peloridis TaxID=488546 RepID=A0A5C7E2G4_9BACT|nr:hypothetical protein [Campylobacter peloridis]TXE84754.1 hypothetical protein FPD46_00530 [Campylobacter peloridis]
MEKQENKDNPFAKVDKIEKQKKEFIEKAQGETHFSRKKDKIGRYILLDSDLSDRLEEYIKLEAKRFETKSYIFNEALDKWLESKGF